MAAKTSEKPIASIYAQALYEAAVEKNALAEVSAEVKMLRELVHRTPQIEHFLVSPTISFQDKRRTLEAALKDVHVITLNFLLVLVKRSRGGLLAAITDAFIEFSNEKAGLASIEVRSPQKLSDTERDRLSAVLARKLSRKVSIRETLRPELLGGVVVLHGDKMWDGSVATRLKRLTEKMEAVKLQAVKWND